MSKDHFGTNIKVRVCNLTFSGKNSDSIGGKEKGQCTRESGDPNRLVVGNSDNGGAANVNWDHPDNSNDNVGFRAAVVLSLSEIRPSLSRVGLIFRLKMTLSIRLTFCLFLEERILIQDIFYYQVFLDLYKA